MRLNRLFSVPKPPAMHCSTTPQASSCFQEVLLRAGGIKVITQVLPPSWPLRLLNRSRLPSQKFTVAHFAVTHPLRIQPAEKWSAANNEHENNQSSSPTPF